MPDWLENDYKRALWDMAEYGCNSLREEWGTGVLKSILALLAIVKENRDLGELIIEVDEGCERNLLDKFFEG